MCKIFGVFLFLLVVSCQSKNSAASFNIVYKNDKQGNTIIGSKEELISCIRGGSEIKLGWGVKGENHSIEHLSVPIWIAVLDESEVIVHLDAQILSEIDWGNLGADYADSTLLDQEWRVVITTKGEFDAVWYDRKSGNVIERRPQNHIISWFAKCARKNGPLFHDESKS